MAGQDFRVPRAAIERAFAVDATVTRPAPNDEPIETEGLVWLPLRTEDVPMGAELTRRESIRVASLPKADVPTAPRHTEILAPEYKGGPILGWRVDGTLHPEVDDIRVIVSRDEDLDPT